jgi:hypothetical protein
MNVYVLVLYRVGRSNEGVCALEFCALQNLHASLVAITLRRYQTYKVPARLYKDSGSEAPIRIPIAPEEELLLFESGVTISAPIFRHVHVCNKALKHTSFLNLRMGFVNVFVIDLAGCAAVRDRNEVQARGPDSVGHQLSA